MAEPYEIFRGVPIPPVDRRSERKRKYPVEEMSVGDGIFVAGRSRASLSAYISRITKDLPGTYSVRSCWMRKIPKTPGGTPQWSLCEPDDEGARKGTAVWRVK